MARLIGSEGEHTTAVIQCSTEVVVKASIERLKSIGSEGEREKMEGVEEKGTVFLTNLIKKLEAGVVRGNGTSKSEKLLTSTVTFIVKGANLICDAAMDKYSSSPSQETVSKIQSHLKRTLVSTVLPLTATVTSVYADQLWLATPILPYVVYLTKVLDKLNGISDDAEMSHQALQKVEDFEVRIVQGLKYFNSPLSLLTHLGPSLCRSRMHPLVLSALTDLLRLVAFSTLLRSRMTSQ